MHMVLPFTVHVSVRISVRVSLQCLGNVLKKTDLISRLLLHIGIAQSPDDSTDPEKKV